MSSRFTAETVYTGEGRFTIGQGSYACSRRALGDPAAAPQGQDQLDFPLRTPQLLGNPWRRLPSVRQLVDLAVPRKGSQAAILIGSAFLHDAPGNIARTGRRQGAFEVPSPLIRLPDQRF